MVNLIPEWVAGFIRNHRQVISGISGRFGPESTQRENTAVIRLCRVVYMLDQQEIMTDISTQLTRIRDVINVIKVTDELAKNRRNWLILTSSLDAVEDTELAIESYSKHFGTSMDFASGYLEVYGVLQAMYVQQDAVRNIFKAMNIPLDRNDDLETIRLARNIAIGHPTESGKSSYYITRLSMQWERFTLLKAGHKSSEENSRIEVDLNRNIEIQKQIIYENLKRCADILNERYSRYIYE